MTRAAGGGGGVQEPHGVAAPQHARQEACAKLAAQAQEAPPNLCVPDGNNRSQIILWPSSCATISVKTVGICNRIFSFMCGNMNRSEICQVVRSALFRGCNQGD